MGMDSPSNSSSIFIYQQATGILKFLGLAAIENPQFLAYAGRGEGLNNPAMQNVPKVGPLPQGRYLIAPPADDPVVGEFALRLSPYNSNEMFGRADFFIHGDNPQMNHTASEGCIVTARADREYVAEKVARGFNVLQVVAGQ